MGFLITDVNTLIQAAVTRLQLQPPEKHFQLLISLSDSWKLIFLVVD